jgi:hypothetical protein
MPEILLGAVVLIVLLFLFRGFMRADPKVLVKAVRYAAATLLLLAAIGLAAFDRVGVAMLLASMAYGMFTGGSLWPGGWPHWHFPHTRGPRPPPGQSTRVATDWIEMELDHDTGAMQGRILKGSFSGRLLDALSDAEVVRLYGEAGGLDLETARLLEAYLDRRLGADWRTKANGDAAASRARARTSAGMTREEAYRVLGLEPGAGEDEIRAAYKRLMLNLHPDRGGSDYLAAKLNEAKDALLG